jgi:hypothetical protein
LSRLAVGVIAALVAVPTALASAYLEARLFGRIHPWLILFVALGAGGGVLTAADKLGILREAYREPTLLGFGGGLRESPPPVRGREPRSD